MATKKLEDKLNAMLGMTAEELDELAQAYENDEVEFSAGDEVRDGSPFDYVGTKRETFVLQAADFRGAFQAAQMDGCSKSDVYRTALREYLDRRGLAHA
ncbi:NADP oxidoreductase [Xiamenia xianingshaonis]|uniref:NADP oxidoreductase n=1 Tax=Xiamenia xianingshaonis TaxID=2682776 RepID=A0A9E6SUP5_9ACTN|nr:NADP oxidoreductase [Xiamenia xianingshaonis]NHM13198.1 NADP oxidoreductase [Xiamenia xianingshaonis]QTU84711.1 NADP oxidoreductase [Xiamenia xianingshaonis]